MQSFRSLLCGSGLTVEFDGLHSLLWKNGSNPLTFLNFSDLYSGMSGFLIYTKSFMRCTAALSISIVIRMLYPLLYANLCGTSSMNTQHGDWCKIWLSQISMRQTIAKYRTFLICKRRNKSVNVRRVGEKLDCINIFIRRAFKFALGLFYNETDEFMLFFFSIQAIGTASTFSVWPSKNGTSLIHFLKTMNLTSTTRCG